MPVVVYEVKDRTAYITLNRPERMNAIDPALAQGLVEALTNVRNDPDVWVAIITGAGDRAFCAGADLLRMGERAESTAQKPEQVEAANPNNLYEYIRHTYKPVISAVNGYALAGGAGIVLSTDVRIMSEQAQLGWPHAKRGIGSVSGPSLLAHAIPLNKALEIEFFAESLSAARCLELGLVNEVVSHEKLMDAAKVAAEKIKANSPVSLRTIKEAAIRGLDLPTNERIKLAASLLQNCLASEDAREGLRAFAEKRAPVWTGH
jgi:enoyl-CoA hydratase/carnithine racemase